MLAGYFRLCYRLGPAQTEPPLLAMNYTRSHTMMRFKTLSCVNKFVNTIEEGSVSYEKESWIRGFPLLGMA